MTEVVYAFCRRWDGVYPAVGRGVSQQRQQWYNRPTSTGSVVQLIGEGYHLSRLQGSHDELFEVNADHWKTWVHQRLTTPVGQPGALTLFQAEPHSHLSLAKHLTAERQTTEFIAGKGVVTQWERVRRNNHWLDALYNACAAGHVVGVRLYGEDPVEVPPPRRPLTAREQREAEEEQARWNRTQDRRDRWNPRY